MLGREIESSRSEEDSTTVNREKEDAYQMEQKRIKHACLCDLANSTGHGWHL